MTPRPEPTRPGHARSTLPRHVAIMGLRAARYEAFARFLRDAPGRLQRLFNQLPEGVWYRTAYDLVVAPGGANGGFDPRTLEVFFGARPFDTTRVPPAGSPAPTPFTPTPSERTLAERGATLLYARTDRGEVLCILRPAHTEYTSQRESEIILGEVDPFDLDSPAVLQRHLRWLLAYMAATSLDGFPHRGQRWRYWYLRNLCRWRDASTGKWRRRRVVTWVRKIGNLVVTVGLSGFLLYFIQRVWPLPDTVTPAIQRAAATAHQDQLELRASQEKVGTHGGDILHRATPSASSPPAGGSPRGR